MPNDFIDGIGDIFDDGENDPYIPTRYAKEAIESDYPLWKDAVDNGLAEWETASLMAAFGVENPYNVDTVTVEHAANGEWSISISDGNELHEIDLGYDLPDWVFDWFYQMADDFGWDWELIYL